LAKAVQADFGMIKKLGNRFEILIEFTNHLMEVLANKLVQLLEEGEA
jgi:hypothetical protein